MGVVGNAAISVASARNEAVGIVIAVVGGDAVNSLGGAVAVFAAIII